jgi:hypothetical protein
LQPSAPHVFPLHAATQQLPPRQLDPSQAQSSAQLSQVSPASQLPSPQSVWAMQALSAQI